MGSRFDFGFFVVLEKKEAKKKFRKMAPSTRSLKNKKVAANKIAVKSVKML